MIDDSLTIEEKKVLLREARKALEFGVAGTPLEELDLDVFPQKLQEPGASFVTLTKGGQLRGCIGTLEAYQPLIEDVREHTVAAALNDYRFPPVNPGELADLSIEVSRLSSPRALDYKDSDDLLKKIRPGIDGVVIKDGIQRATFLPQVWEKISSPEEFLNHLCAKLGAAPDLWRRKKLDFLIYQVEEFHESD
jgi:AmmeMemoRadiSam system protein A